jgi:cytochrome c5
VLKKEVEPTLAELARGKTVYVDNCAYCHDSGLTGAQKLTDAKAWTPLIKEGKDYLYNAAINGSFGGPAKGGNIKLSDADTVGRRLHGGRSKIGDRCRPTRQTGRGKITRLPVQ